MKYAKKLLGFHQKINKFVFRPLPDNIGTLFSVYNLILTQLDEICKNNNNWGAIKKKIGVP
jgi:hypothetical protein